MSGLPGGTSMGIARQIGRTTAQTFERFARENRIVGNCIVSVLHFGDTGKEGRAETMGIWNGKCNSFYRHLWSLWKRHGLLVSQTHHEDRH